MEPEKYKAVMSLNEFDTSAQLLSPKVSFGNFFPCGGKREGMWEEGGGEAGMEEGKNRFYSYICVLGRQANHWLWIAPFLLFWEQKWIKITTNRQLQLVKIFGYNYNGTCETFRFNIQACKQKNLQENLDVH